MLVKYSLHIPPSAYLSFSLIPTLSLSYISPRLLTGRSIPAYPHHPFIYPPSILSSLQGTILPLSPQQTSPIITFSAIAPIAM